MICIYLLKFIFSRYTHCSEHTSHKLRSYPSVYTREMFHGSIKAKDIFQMSTRVVLL